MYLKTIIHRWSKITKVNFLFRFKSIEDLKSSVKILQNIYTQ